MLLILDDERDIDDVFFMLKDQGIIIGKDLIYQIERNVQSALNLFLKYSSQIKYVSLDHDLGYELTGYDFVKELIVLDAEKKIDLNNYTFFYHTANPVGKENMKSLLTNYLKHKNS